MKLAAILAALMLLPAPADARPGDDYVTRRLGHLIASVEAGRLQRQVHWANVEIRRHRSWRPAPCSRLWRNFAVYVRLRADALLDTHRWRWLPDLHHTLGDRVALGRHYGYMADAQLRYWASACERRYLLP